MQKVDELFAIRKSLDEICRVPDNIISVYSLEQHIWAETDEALNKAARKQRIPARQTVEEFQINPVRPFLNDILRLMAAPYRPVTLTRFSGVSECGNSVRLLLKSDRTDVS